MTTVAATARAALEVFGPRQFDVRISDIAMPEDDGYNVIRKVRGSNGRRPCNPGWSA